MKPDLNKNRIFFICIINFINDMKFIILIYLNIIYSFAYIKYTN